MDLSAHWSMTCHLARIGHECTKTHTELVSGFPSLRHDVMILFYLIYI